MPTGNKNLKTAARQLQQEENILYTDALTRVTAMYGSTEPVTISEVDEPLQRHTELYDAWDKFLRTYIHNAEYGIHPVSMERNDPWSEGMLPLFTGKWLMINGEPAIQLEYVVGFGSLFLHDGRKGHEVAPVDPYVTNLPGEKPLAMVHVHRGLVIGETEAVRQVKNPYATRIDGFGKRVAGLHDICHNEIHYYPNVEPSSMTDFSKYSGKVETWADFSRIVLNPLGVECVGAPIKPGVIAMLRDRRHDIDFEESVNNVIFHGQLKDGRLVADPGNPGERDVVLQIPATVWEESTEWSDESYFFHVPANEDKVKFFKELAKAVKFSQGTARLAGGSDGSFEVTKGSYNFQ